MLLATAVLDVSAETVPENLRPDDMSANLFITNSRSSGALTYGRETLLTIFLLGIAPDDTHA